MEQSNCCGASRLWETDICKLCKEHAEFEDWEQLENNQDEDEGSFNNRVKKFWKEWKLIKR